MPVRLLELEERSLLYLLDIVMGISRMPGYMVSKMKLMEMIYVWMFMWLRTR